ncbi:MAG: DMT family transporter [Cypionkella sp.]|uniref:DMT family transporter n=1 Tax=Cypionkella sp. TaxID=2811411 RepID=UPI002ABA78B1|nr:DMT family transporter [Cypionkella sp.]MDZ4311777.1 DMT family transporter [Cypionkella sp.]
MSTDTLRYALIMLLAGIGIPVLAALNAQLGARIAAPVAASVVLFAVALLACILVLAFSGQVSALAALPAQPKHLFAAGLFVAFYVLTVTWVAPRFGVGNAVFCVLLGQMIAATLIDQFGLFGAAVHTVTATRAAGIVAMVAGLALIQRG